MLDQTLKGASFHEGHPLENDYEVCQFVNCNFTDVDLSNVNFLECEFDNCIFSSTKLINTAFKDVRFIECKLLGIDFGDVNPFLLKLSFDSCQLSLSSFYKLKLKGTNFSNSNLDDADFSETDLTKANFSGTSLKNTIFDRTNLIEADFRTAENYTIDPENNRLKKAKFSADGLRGLLVKYGIVVK